MADIAAAESMSLVEIMGALTERGVDFMGCFDKTVLLQRLVEAMQAEAAVRVPRQIFTAIVGYFLLKHGGKRRSRRRTRRRW